MKTDTAAGQLPRKTAPRRVACCAALLGTVPLGLVWRLAPLHLSPFAFKYGGSVLWAMAVYWTVGLFWPRGSSFLLAGAAALISLAVELGKRIFWPPLDHFRETLAGKLLLGRYFSWGAIAAYWIAIIAVAWVDTVLQPGRRVTRDAACPRVRRGDDAPA